MLRNAIYLDICVKELDEDDNYGGFETWLLSATEAAVVDSKN